jgi:hypothetical protein
MRASDDDDWDGFMSRLNQALPKRSDTMQLLLAKEQQAAAQSTSPSTESLPLFARLPDVDEM